MDLCSLVALYIIEKCQKLLGCVSVYRFMMIIAFFSGGIIVDIDK